MTKILASAPAPDRLGAATHARKGATAWALLLAAAGACAPPPPSPPPPPPIDTDQLRASLERRTQLDEATRLLFDWDLSEQGARASGRGVARVEPPYRARLDLFMGNGETVARAALVNDELIVPPGVPEGIIPPPRLIWASLGVFNPGRGASLVSAAERAGGVIELRFGVGGGEELLYRVVGDRIVEAELSSDGHAVHTVTLSRDGEDRYPSQATYRNLAAFRELRLVRRSVENVESYPPDIWFPAR